MGTVVPSKPYYHPVVLGLVLVTCLGACADRAEDRQRLEEIRRAYSQAISTDDFVTSLHGDDVAKVLRALDGFDGHDESKEEAQALAARIRMTQTRNPLPSDEDEEDGIFAGVGDEALPETSSSDPAEAIWLKALRVGSFRADFERYWLGCFQPVGGDVDRWRPLDVPPCRRRPGMDRIGEVRFKGGQIHRLVTHEQLLKATEAESSSTSDP